ncbi:MAG TPA: metalloregulator ArsR/SmtB family transcription factor [Acidimicrobiales bacterium]|nr:metalloregulator ArsR/SmtB family transcription factor [Acidimicrobiales bacterium]
MIEVSSIDQCCPSVLGAPLGDAQAAQLAKGFAALSDPVRLRVLSMLGAAPAGEVCMCEFVEPLGKSQPRVSHHLKILAEAGLVTGTAGASGSGFPGSRPAGGLAFRARYLRPASRTMWVGASRLGGA